MYIPGFAGGAVQLWFILLQCKLVLDSNCVFDYLVLDLFIACVLLMSSSTSSTSWSSSFCLYLPYLFIYRVLHFPARFSHFILSLFIVFLLYLCSHFHWWYQSTLMFYKWIHLNLISSFLNEIHKLSATLSTEICLNINISHDTQQYCSPSLVKEFPEDCSTEDLLELNFTSLWYYIRGSRFSASSEFQQGINLWPSGIMAVWV